MNKTHIIKFVVTCRSIKRKTVIIFVLLFIYFRLFRAKMFHSKLISLSIIISIIIIIILIIFIDLKIQTKDYHQYRTWQTQKGNFKYTIFDNITAEEKHMYVLCTTYICRNGTNKNWMKSLTLDNTFWILRRKQEIH